MLVLLLWLVVIVIRVILPHCAFGGCRHHLSTLVTKAPGLIQGENATVVVGTQNDRTHAQWTVYSLLTPLGDFELCNSLLRSCAAAMVEW
jgi:hypothetical protein